ncbi:MAG: 50S ribosomal protein L9 [Nitrospiraceae bacterium]|nr:MAG: 50S ribosomal protein L9 [Nitrospiraceae bacterium]
MKVILKEDVKNLGKIGDIVNVAEGHARNFLIPKKLAVEAVTGNIKELEHQKKVIQEKAKKEKNSAQALSEKISSLNLLIKAKAGEEEKLFGSITSMDIAAALKNEGIDIDKKKISVEEPIKRLGSYTVGVKVHPEITTQLTITVAAQ